MGSARAELARLCHHCARPLTCEHESIESKAARSGAHSAAEVEAGAALPHVATRVRAVPVEEAQRPPVRHDGSARRCHHRSVQPLRVSVCSLYFTSRMLAAALNEAHYTRNLPKLATS